MKLTVNFVRKQLEKLKPVITGCSLAASRAGQTAIGELISLPLRKEERFEKIVFPDFECGLITPEKQTDSDSAILYIHGGGYVAGNLEYARGFGSVLAAETGIRVFCPAYRLAPENKYPAALRDCLFLYRYITETLEIPSRNLILCGESAGGGLIYSICMKLRKMEKPLPAGIVAISPWTDLTMSGKSYEEKREVDPSMTKERLEYFADCYVPEDISRSESLISPVYGELNDMPPSLIFSGGDEVMLDDAVELNAKLLLSNCESTHIIRPKMWHAYIVYGLDETHDDMEEICRFIKKCLQTASPAGICSEPTRFSEDTANSEI